MKKTIAAQQQPFLKALEKQLKRFVLLNSDGIAVRGPTKLAAVQQLSDELATRFGWEKTLEALEKAIGFLAEGEKGTKPRLWVLALRDRWEKELNGLKNAAPLASTPEEYSQGKGGAGIKATASSPVVTDHATCASDFQSQVWQEKARQNSAMKAVIDHAARKLGSNYQDVAWVVNKVTEKTGKKKEDVVDILDKLVRHGQCTEFKTLYATLLSEASKKRE